MFGLFKRRDVEIDELEREIANLTFKLQKSAKDLQEAGVLLASKDLELSRAQTLIKNFDRVKSEFITVAAHQLRTPLSAIKWALAMVHSNEYSDEKDLLGLVEKAQSSTEHAIELVNSLLQVHIIQSEKVEYVFGPTDVKKIIEGIVDRMKPEIEKRAIHMESNFSQNPVIFADERWLLGLFQNIIENALKYTLDEGTVSISTAIEGTFLKITIADTGIGIPKDQQERIFTQFFRGDNAMKLRPSGTGLGLYIAKQITERHNGKIWFISNEKDGTSFFILLPITQ